MQDVEIELNVKCRLRRKCDAGIEVQCYPLVFSMPGKGKTLVWSQILKWQSNKGN
jgi:hypothetical protein